MFGKAVLPTQTILSMGNSWDRLIHAAGLDDEEAGRRVGALVDKIGHLVGGNPSQTITNWRTRGVAVGGALAAQVVYRCDANWLLTGKGRMRVDWPFSTELRDAVDSLTGLELLHLENVMRAHIKMSRLVDLGQDFPEPLTQPQTDERQRGTKPLLGRFNSEIRTGQEGSSSNAVDRPGKTQAKRGRGRP